MTANHTVESQRLYAKHVVGDNEIRLISLQPSPNLEDRILATMNVVPLDDAGRFHAISYAWGTPVCDDHIICDGISLPVTRNLHAGLKRIREKMAVRKEDRIPPKWFLPTVWADAVCIDQSNDQEKARQVQMMADIYRGAASSIIWLGEASNKEGADVFATLRGLKSDNEAAAILQTLIKRSWFSRRWIIQELMSNPIRHMLLGATRFSFDALPNNSRNLGTLEPGSFLDTLLGTQRTRMLSTNTFTEQQWAKGMTPLMLNLISFRSAACENPLDLVYALLNISYENARAYPEIEMLPVDYTITPHMLWRNVSQFYYEQGDRQNPLFRISLIMATTTNHSQQSTLPSWIPDWSIEAKYHSTLHQSLVDLCFTVAKSNHLFKSMLAFKWSLKNVTVVEDELHLRGWVLGTCKHGDFQCLCADARHLMSDYHKPCMSDTDPRRYTKTWPKLNAAGASSDGCFRLQSCFEVHPFTEASLAHSGERANIHKSIVWLEDFMKSLRPEAVTTMRIV